MFTSVARARPGSIFYSIDCFKATRYLALSAVVAGLCVACQEPPAATSQPLIVGNSPWPGFVAQFIAEEKGFYDDEGIVVKEKHFQVSTDVDAALLANKMDLAWTGVPDMLVMANEIPSLRLIAVSDYSDGADGILATGVDKPQDLVGKTIAWEDLPLQALLLQAYLAKTEEDGNEETDIKIKDLDLRVMPAAESATAFAAGRVDVAVTFEPYLSDAVKEGRGEVVFSSEDTNLIAGGLIGKDSTLNDRREDIEAYLRALDRGLDFYENNRAEALEIVANKLELPVEELGPIMENVRLLSPAEHSAVIFNTDNPLNIIDSISFAAEVGTDLRLVKPSVEASTLYDASYTRGAATTH
ncbi:MAG: ABC transporter substrate-binding protein [Phormidesmis sp.]